MRSLLDELVDFVRRHGLRPRIGHVFSFDQLPEAHRLVESRRSWGKVVVRGGDR
jgi:NADPH:quinone reductase-like Zn-dependent oxidoreductase